MRAARRRARESSDERLEPISGIRRNGLALSLSRNSSVRGLDHLTNLGSETDEDEQALWGESDENDASTVGSNLLLGQTKREPDMIADPGKPTPMERRWLAAMSIGKDPEIVTRFARSVDSRSISLRFGPDHVSSRINRYFDGKRTDDEILYRAEISRKQLREVLQHYGDYVCND